MAGPSGALLAGVNPSAFTFFHRNPMESNHLFPHPGVRPTRRGVLALGAAAAMLPGVLRAEQYPSRYVTVVVPFAAGGTGDIVARIVAARLGERLGQQVVVDNKPGGAGAVGWGAVARSRNDGYIVLSTDTSYAMAVALKAKQSFDLRKAFVHVATTASAPFILLAGSSVKAKTVPELLAFARANPGKLNYGSGGVGTSSHLGAEWFMKLTGVSMVQVPYRGGSSVISDLIGGQVDLAFLAVPSALQHLRAGKLRALVVSAERRSTALPDVPSAPEAGVPGFVGVNWFGVSAPAGTPDAVVARLNAEVNAVLQLPEIKEKFASLGLDANPGSPQQAAAFVEEEIARWTTVVKAANIQPE